MKTRFEYAFVLAALAIVFVACADVGGLKFRDPQKGVIAGKPTPSPAPTPTPTPKPGVDEWFARLHYKIIRPKCLECHHPPTPKAKVDLTSYESIMAIEGLVIPNDPENSGLYHVMLENEMPPKPNDPLPDDDKNSIFKWISAGAPKEVPLP